MKNEKIIRNHYLSISYKILISKIIIHFFLFLLEIFLILIQVIEIIYNIHKLNKKDSKIFFMPISSFLTIIRKIPIIISTIIYDILILIILLNYFILNNYRVKKNIFNIIMINLSELFFYRILSLFIFNYMSIFKDIYFIINMILTIPYIFVLFSNFYYNHLTKFFPTSLIKYPYDFFSMIIDLFLINIKFCLSLSLTNSNENISIFLFYLSIVIIFILFFYLTYIIIFKSYYLMNNCSLNKIKYAILLSFCILIIFVLIIDKKKIFNKFFIFCYCNIFLISIIFINYNYDPFQFSKFEKDDNIENIFYYFFILDRDKNKNFLIEEKIEEHISKCNLCNLCIKYKNIKNKINEKVDLYSIISNCNDHICNLLNKIIRGIKKNGINSIKNNSYFLINIIYIYCISIKLKDYNSILTTELLFEVINSENNFLEDYNKSLECIKYTNDFFIKANKTIKTIEQIINEKNEEIKIKKYFQLGEELKNIKHKEAISNNFNYNGNNNIEGLPDSNNLLIICSLFYEELFNECISNSGILIRDSFNLIDELINNNHKNNKQITLEINIQTFYVKIIRAGGQFNKYENNNFFDFFPSIFKNNQINEMKNSILHSNENNIYIISKKKKKINNKEREKQYINLNFIIEKKENNKISYKLLKLKLRLILLTHISNKIYLNGIYNLDNNIIISEKSNGEEIILYFGNKELIQNNINNKYNNNIIKKVKKNKYFNGYKLLKEHSCYIAYQKYNFYCILLSQKKSLNKNNDKNMDKSNNISEKDKENNLQKNKSFNYDELVSQSPSINSSTPNNNYNFYNKGNKQIKKDDNILKEFKIVKYELSIFIILLLLFIIIQNFLLNYHQKKISNESDFYFIFKDYITTFNYLFFSVLSLSCTAISPKFAFCRNYLEEIAEIIVRNKYPNYSANLFLINLLKRQLIDFKKLLFTQNELLLELLNNKLNKLSIYLSNDNSYNNYFNTNKIHYKINQNITKNKITLSLKADNITFNDFILLITSRFTILTKNFDELEEPIYILNKTGKETFNNVNIKEELSSYQENIYLMILDFKSFKEQVDLMITEVWENSMQISRKFKKLLYFFIFFFLFLIIVFIIFLFEYSLMYYIIIIRILKNINNNLKERIGDFTVKEVIKHKLDNLKIMLKFYDNDINKTIYNLNKIYDNYKENYNLKIKEETKFFKKVKTKEIKKNNNENFLKSIRIIRKYKIYELSGKKSFHINLVLFLLIISMIIFIIINIIWKIYFKKEEILGKWAPLINEVCLETNRLMSNFLTMVYNNQTLEEVSESYDSKDYLSYIHTKLSYLYQAEKYKKQLLNIIEFNEMKISYDCTSFYENLNNDIFKSLLNKFSDEQLKFNSSLYSFCQMSKVMEFENYNTIYLLLYNSVIISMENFKNKKYDDIIEFIDNYKVYNIEIMYLFTYVYLIEIMNKNVQDSMTTMKNNKKLNINIHGFLLILLLIIYIFFTFCVYINNINNDCKNFNHIKKVFKVCDTNE